MPKRLTILQVNERLSDYDCTMAADAVYIDRRSKMKLKCLLCRASFCASISSLYNGCGCKCKHVSKGGRKPIYSREEDRLCLFCGKQFEVPIKNRGKIYCNRTCVTAMLNSGKYKDANSKGGKLSVTKQGRRSKNEIYFADLCKEYFGDANVLTNEPMFDGWDADVIITSTKTAVMWNGAWHYKQIQKGHSVAQTQNRDRLKERIINKRGYKCYTIKDMGKHNKKFVEYQFQLFLFMLIRI